MRAVAQAVHDDPGMLARLHAALDQVAPRTPEASEQPRETDLTASVHGHSPCDEPAIVGASAPMREVMEKIRRYAETDLPVLITGESGTGKEVAARAIHRRSARSAGPFVAINCAALPPGLAASELFGHERGAFTGAVRRKLGKLEAGRGGTVLLDEIGDLPADIQGHLLRFLQERTIERVGGNSSIAVDVRVIAATNVDLRQAMEQGRFREDLFYRLHVLGLHMPPLRERGDDVILLARALLRRFNQEISAAIEDFDASALAAMVAYPWPGNIRELVACVRRGVVLADGPLVQEAELRVGAARPLNSAHPADRRTRLRLDARSLTKALAQNRFNVSHCARQLGVSRMTIYRLMHSHRIPTRFGR